MPFSNTTFAKATFKFALGLAHTSNVREFYSESDVSSFIIASQNIWAENIDKVPIVAETANIVSEELILHLEQVPGYNAYYSKLPTTGSLPATLVGKINPLTGLQYAMGDRIGHVVTKLFGNNYTTELRDPNIAPSAPNNIISQGNSSNWFLDPFSGIITQENNLSLTTSARIVCRVYTGQLLGDRINKLQQELDAAVISGGSVTPTQLQDLENILLSDINAVSAALNNVAQGDVTNSQLANISGFLDTRIDNKTFEIQANTSLISGLSGNVSTNSQGISNLNVALNNILISGGAVSFDDLANLQNQITTNDSDILTLSGDINNNINNIITNQNEISTLANTDLNLQNQIITNTSNILSLSGQVETDLSTINLNINAISGNTTLNSNNLISQGDQISALQLELNSAVISGGSVSQSQISTLQSEIDAISGDVNSNITSISGLNDTTLLNAQNIISNTNLIGDNANNILNNFNNISLLKNITGNLSSDIFSNQTDILTLSGSIGTNTINIAQNINDIIALTADLDAAIISGGSVTTSDLNILQSLINQVSGATQTNSQDISANVNDILNSQQTIVTNSNNISDNSLNIADVNSNLSSISGNLQNQISSNDTDINTISGNVSNLSQQFTNLDLTYATDVSVANISGNLQNQISSNDTDINTISGNVSNLSQQFTNLDLTYATDVSVANISGNLQNQISSNDTDINTISGNLLSHNHIKSDITNFVESDYVHTIGNEIINGQKTFANDVSIQGTLTVAGSAFTVNSQTVNTSANILNINEGEVGTGVTNRYAGIEIDRGISSPYRFVFDENDNVFKVGVISAGIPDTSGANSIQTLQPVATRTTITSGYIPFGNDNDQYTEDSNIFWDNNNKRLGIGINNPGYDVDVVGGINAANLYVNGTPVALSGVNASHINSTSNPHLVTTGQIGAMPLSGGTFTGNVSGLLPTISSHLATRGYVDSAIISGGGTADTTFTTGKILIGGNQIIYKPVFNNSIVFGNGGNNFNGVPSTHNTFIGIGAGIAVIGGDSNTLIGSNAGNALTTGVANVIIGSNAGTILSTNSSNVIIGDFAGNQATGADNTFIGWAAGTLVTSGTNNTFIGRGTGGITTGSDNIMIGMNVVASSELVSNELNIGNLIKGVTNQGLLTINGTGAITVPIGTTAQIPTIVGNGMIRYDSTLNKFRAYENGAWTDIIGGGFIGTATGSLIPDVSGMYDLGSALLPWRSLYLLGNSIKLGNITISSDTTKLYNGPNALITTKDSIVDFVPIDTGSLKYDGFAIGNTNNTSGMEIWGLPAINSGIVAGGGILNASFVGTHYEITFSALITQSINIGDEFWFTLETGIFTNLLGTTINLSSGNITFSSQGLVTTVGSISEGKEKIKGVATGQNLSGTGAQWTITAATLFSIRVWNRDPDALPNLKLADSVQTQITSISANTSHITDTTNPHAVTKTQVGLSNVVNLDTSTTTNITEGSNLYYTDAKVASSPSVIANTAHAGNIANPHSVTSAQVGAVASTGGAFTGVVTGVTPTLAGHLATKGYVDSVSGGGAVTSVNGLTGVVSLTTSNINEGTNLYYTEGRVTANTAVSLNTAHAGNTANPHSVTSAQVGAVASTGGTFTGVVTGVTPTLGNHLTTKNYVDSVSGGAVTSVNGHVGVVVLNRLDLGLLFGAENDLLGTAAGAALTLGINNSLIGQNTGVNITTGSYNIAVGSGALANNISSSYNVAIGNNTLQLTSAGYNTAVGYLAGALISSGSRNTLLGWNAGGNIGQGNDNIVIGYNTDVVGGHLSNQLNIGDTIYGNLSTKQISIGTTSPNAKAILDLTSTTQVFLPPRMTAVQRDAIATPPTGGVIYNTTTNTLQTFNGTIWG